MAKKLHTFSALFILILNDLNTILKKKLRYLQHIYIHCNLQHIIIIHSSYIALFSALEQTHCAHVGSGVLIALFGCCMAGATWNAAVSAQVLCTSFNHAPVYRVTSFKAVICHLHFWQTDRDLLRATAVTRGWNGYRNKSQHRKLTLEPGTFRSRVQRSNHWAMSWCLMSSDVSWHIWDKLWPMPKHGSVNLYVHGNLKAR